MGDAASENARHEDEDDRRRFRCPPDCVRVKRWVKRGEWPKAQGRLICCHEIERSRVLLELEFDKPRGVSDNVA